MNSVKCASAASSGKFLGFTLHKKGINLNLAKAKAIRVIEPPKMVKQLKLFLGRVSYIPRFITTLAELLKPFQKHLKKYVSFKWDKEQEVAFQKELRMCSALLRP